MRGVICYLRASTYFDPERGDNATNIAVREPFSAKTRDPFEDVAQAQRHTASLMVLKYLGVLNTS